MPAPQYDFDAFPPANLDWVRLISAIGPATAALARYDSRLSMIPNPEILLSPLTIQEAVMSSRIEGTRATISDVLGYEAGEMPSSEELRNDIVEVVNYRAAMRSAEFQLRTVPLAQRVILETHRILLSGARGENRSPGAFRRIPVWIGSPESRESEASFIPASADLVPKAMGRLEGYIHAEMPDLLVQCALLHVELEGIHPFMDGNGRIGRMLIPLFLWQRGLIQRPMFYISAYIEMRKSEYYDRLQAVSSEDDWTGWCLWFIEAVRHQAEENSAKASAILSLYDSMKERVIQATQSRYAILAQDKIFELPLFRSSDFISSTNIPDATARRILVQLRDSGTLKVYREAVGRKPAVYVFPEVLNIAEGRDVF